MFKRHLIWWVLGGIIAFLLSVNFLTFHLSQSTSETNQSLQTFRAGEELPESMTPGFSLAYVIEGESGLAEALAEVLSEELESETTAGSVTALSGLSPQTGAPLLIIDLTSDRIWTPVFGQATLTAQIYFAHDGDAPWPLDEAVVFDQSPALKATGTFTLNDTSWGLISKPAYIEHLATEMAVAITVGLQQEVLVVP
jgi:hypothetical protein